MFATFDNSVLVTYYKSSLSSSFLPSPSSFPLFSSVPNHIGLLLSYPSPIPRNKRLCMEELQGHLIRRVFKDQRLRMQWAPNHWSSEESPSPLRLRPKNLLQRDLCIDQLPVPLIAIFTDVDQLYNPGLTNFLAGGFAFVFGKWHPHPFRCQSARALGYGTFLDRRPTGWSCLDNQSSSIECLIN